MKIDNHLIVRVYTDMRQSAEMIAAFPKLRREFLDRLSIADDDGEVIWTLLQLCKEGNLPKGTLGRS